MPRIVKPTAEAIAEAAAVLQREGVVAFPTETVYGLGVPTLSRAALAKVYELKGRPRDNPLIAHVLDAGQARAIAAGWDERCEQLAGRFWPGPLTLVVRKAAGIPEQATAGYPTIAVRSPSHPVARQLLERFGGAISAPSANRSGHVSPTTAQHVFDDFADVEDLLILDGGPCEVGIESTVVDLMRTPPMVLRPGSVGADEIGQVLGREVGVFGEMEQAASPGTASSHYAPRTPVVLVEPGEVERAVGQMRERAVVLAMRPVEAGAGLAIIEMPREARAYASGIYDALRRADGLGAERIVIEMPEEAGALWDAIRNRLRRAAGVKSD